MSKRQARIERKKKRQLEQQEKSARLRLRPVEENTPRARENPDSIFATMMTWDCDFPDCEDAWSWGVKRQWAGDDWNNDILPKLQEWQALTWSEIDSHSSDKGHKMHHNMDTVDICDEAKKRLEDIERYSDVIFRFRLGNLPRLWGFRVVSNFSILWFDPTHKVYPTEPD